MLACKANPRCFVGGLRRQMLIKALHSPECRACPVHLSVRPEVSWISSTGGLCKLCNACCIPAALSFD